MTSKAVIAGFGDCIGVEYWTESGLSACFKVEGLRICPINRRCVQISLADRGATVGWILADEYEVDFNHIDLQVIENRNPSLKPELRLTTSELKSRGIRWKS